MDLKDTVQYCLSKPNAYEDYPFGLEPTVIKIANKIFALIMIKHNKVHISLKCDPFVAQSLREQYPAAVTPGYHLNKQHWNTIVLDGSVPDEELRWMINHSYDLVCKTLTKAARQSVGYNA